MNPVKTTLFYMVTVLSFMVIKRHILKSKDSQKYVSKGESEARAFKFATVIVSALFSLIFATIVNLVLSLW